MTDISPAVLRVVRTTLPVQCPACLDHLGAGPPVGRCPICATPHHVECLTEIGCSSLQCRPGGTLPALPPAPATETPVDPADTLPTVELELWGRDTEVTLLGSLSDWTDYTDSPGVIHLAMHHFAYHDCDDLSDALDEVAQWASEHAPGLLTEPEYPEGINSEGRCPACVAAEELAEPCQHVEEAEEDLTSCDMGLWLNSAEWNYSHLGGTSLRRIQETLFESELHADLSEIVDQLQASADSAADCGGDICGDTGHDDSECPFDGGIDVRLQVDSDVTWTTHEGSSDYDTDHSGYWGAGSVTGFESPEEIRELASDLIEQAVQAYALSPRE